MPPVASRFSRYLTFIQKMLLRFALRSRTKKEKVMIKNIVVPFIYMLLNGPHLLPSISLGG